MPQSSRWLISFPTMKKSKKKLRKLLAQFKDELIAKPYTNGNSEVVDCIGIIIERLNNDRHP